jgi:hypothetical protein
MSGRNPVWDRQPVEQMGPVLDFLQLAEGGWRLGRGVGWLGRGWSRRSGVERRWRGCAGRAYCCTGRAGDADAARDSFAALLPVRERVLGADHSDTLATRRSLAYWVEKAVSAGDAFI